YLVDVSPKVAEWSSVAHNNSLPALWHKLFDPGPKSDLIQPMVRDPFLANAGSLLSCVVILLLMAAVTVVTPSASAADQTFGLAVTAMLLVCPITWGHYFVLLALPLALVWVTLSSGILLKGAFWGVVMV